MQKCQKNFCRENPFPFGGSKKPTFLSFFIFSRILSPTSLLNPFRHFADFSPLVPDSFARNVHFLAFFRNSDKNTVKFSVLIYISRYFSLPFRFFPSFFQLPSCFFAHLFMFSPIPIWLTSPAKYCRMLKS